jgi:hypothetical protein
MAIDMPTFGFGIGSFSGELLKPPPVEPLVATKEALLLREQEIIEYAQHVFERESQSYFGWLLERERKGDGDSFLAGSRQRLADQAHAAALGAVRSCLALYEALEALQEQPYEQGEASDLVVKLAVEVRKEWAPRL